VQAFNLEDTKKLISRVEKLGDVESAAQALKIVQHNSIRWSRKYDKARAGYDKYVFNPKPNQEEPKKAARQHMDAAKNVQDAFEYQYQRAHRALRDAQRRVVG
jgi:hypothetical protein